MPHDEEETLQHNATLLGELADMLEASEILSDYGLSIFIDFEPDMPDNIIAVAEYGGYPIITQTGAAYRSVRVTVRHKNADTAHRAIWDAYKLLDTPEDRIHDSTGKMWKIMQAEQTPYRIAEDISGRMVMRFNMLVLCPRDYDM